MALMETRTLIMKDTDNNTHVICEQHGLLFGYTIQEFFMLMAQAHLNQYIFANIGEDTMRNDSNLGPFGCEQEQNVALESWERLLHFDEYTFPRSDHSAPIFLNDFNTIWGVAEREDLIVKEV